MPPPLTVKVSVRARPQQRKKKRTAAPTHNQPQVLRIPYLKLPSFCRVSRCQQETSPFQDSDPAAVIATALKRTPGAGRERVIDPDNLTSPACAPETYAGSAGATGGGDDATSNPVTGDLNRPCLPAECLKRKGSKVVACGKLQTSCRGVRSVWGVLGRA